MTDALSFAAGEALRILRFVLGAFAHTWPLWMVSIPLAAAVKASSLSSRLGSLVSMRPVSSVIFATLVGAVSPLCSCSVVPVIFSLLTAGVPLAPVMSFWLASPSMDPEVFLLSVSSLGWPLAIARLAATTLMSLGAGFLTIVLERRGFFGSGVLRDAKKARGEAACGCGRGKAQAPRPAMVAAARERRFAPLRTASASLALAPASPCSCSGQVGKEAPAPGGIGGPCCRPEVDGGEPAEDGNFATRFAGELLSSLAFVAKFMAVAYVLEALIKFYLPEAWIHYALGSQNPFSVPIATLVGIPFYTTNAQALGLVGGLLGKGMSGGAALAFLIGGATTTLPAMSAVYGIAKRRVFAVYLGSAIAASLAAGLAWQLFQP